MKADTILPGRHEPLDAQTVTLLTDVQSHLIEQFWREAPIYRRPVIVTLNIE